MISLEIITSEVTKVAQEAGRFIAKERASFDPSKVQLKGKSDLVSYVDKEAEKMIVAALKTLIPDAGFITEEDTANSTDKEYTWIIDPLDGTTNFVHNLPPFSVSIALLHHDSLVSGVIHEVTRNETFYATKGHGAFMNDKAIQVTQVSTIDESLFATGFPIHNFSKIDEYLAILNDLMKNSHGLRRQGSAAVDLAYVACGRYEGFFEYNLNPWDVAAGILIVQEANGIVTDFSGGNNALFGREIVAASAVHQELITVIKKYW
ncbi:MAG: inositol monophosphatase family protein [Cyclobacteriaceae bacterium]